MLTIDQARLHLMHQYWNAANYLTIGQIYLQENPLLQEPLRPEHIKPRLLGHWGTSPGLSFIYVHLNRLIQDHDVDMIYLAGPGHGGPAMLANVYLEGTYTEIYPEITQDAEGLRRLFRQFSTPGGVPSHVSVPTPGSIHEGGELGYVLAHAFGAAFDNPDLIAVAVVGDGEAETAPLEGSWKSIKFLNPVHDGAVLPILHLNGYKISGPTVFGRDDDESIRQVIAGHGYDVHFVEGDDPLRMHQAFAETLETCYAHIRSYQADARTHGFTGVPTWPAIILRTPKGWTGPKEVDGLPIEGTFRAHQVPVGDVKTNAEHLKLLEEWMRRYKPEELFDEEGRFLPELAELAPQGDRRMGANPHADEGVARGADTTLGLGLLGAIAAALTGVADWSDLYDTDLRVGFLHGLLNGSIALTYVASWLLRLTGRRRAGVAVSTAGYLTALFSAYLGGELVFAKGVGVNHIAFAPGSDAYVAVMDATDLAEGKLTRVDVAGIPAVLLKQGSTIYAIAATCTHQGGPLDEGTLKEGEIVQCPWHGSCFHLRNGSVVNGPAVYAQPTFAVRVRKSTIELRRIDHA